VTTTVVVLEAVRKGLGSQLERGNSQEKEVLKEVDNEKEAESEEELPDETLCQ
jgi:hypothetical protein